MIDIIIFSYIIEEYYDPFCMIKYSYLEGPCRDDCECVQLSGLRCDSRDKLCKCFSPNKYWSLNDQMCIKKIDCAYNQYFDLKYSGIMVFLK